MGTEFAVAQRRTISGVQLPLGERGDGQEQRDDLPDRAVLPRGADVVVEDRGAVDPCDGRLCRTRNG